MKSVKRNTGVGFLGAFLFLSFLGLVGVLLVDKENKMFLHMEENFVSHIIQMLQIDIINIYSMQYVAFGLGYIATIAPISIVILGKSIVARINEEKKAKKAFTWIIVFIVAVVVLVLGWVATLAFIKMMNIKMKEFGIIYLYFVVSFAIFSVLFFVAFMAVGILSKAVGTRGGVVEVAEEKETEEKKKEESEEIFPGLKLIDQKYEEIGFKVKKDLEVECEYNLLDFTKGLQAYLATAEKLYYELPMLRAFVAGMSASKLIILEGLSGTGKSSLPREFSGYLDNTLYGSLEEYLENDRPKNTQTFFASVQATWRDRTDVLGFYNDFSHVFKETETLKRLYESSYTPEKFNFMVLDEMNLSRIEYYFADFLSVMEHTDHKEWKVSLMPSLDPEKAPKMFYKNGRGEVEGQVVIPENTWFVGTANKDDSTFTITDKVYDRAAVLEFNDKNIPPVIEEGTSCDPILITPVQLEELFRQAQATEEFCLSEDELLTFNKLTTLVYKKFEINFGNRIQMQIDKFVPVYVACSVSPEASAEEKKLAKQKALDVMFCRKVLHKLEGRFEEYIQKGLEAVQAEIERLYGPGVFEDTERSIEFMLAKLNG